MMIDVQRIERVFVLFNGVPVKYLGPGRHRVLAPFKRVDLERVSTLSLVAELDELRLRLVPAEDLALISNGPFERTVVSLRGQPTRWLGPGAHQVWTVDRTLDRVTGQSVPQVACETFDVSGVEAPPLRDSVKALVPSSDYVEVTAPAGTVALRFVDGQLDAELKPGRHAAWTAQRKVHFAVIDLKERLVHVTGQEVMTKDRVSLRLNASATFQVADARRLSTVARNPDDVLYLALQLAARDAVSTRTLDELLAAREELGKGMASVVADRATSVGLRLIELGLKDIILPGDMKELLNKVIAAQKEAEANVILRREETAATRSLAQTAKVLGEHPLLLRLKELEAYKELAQRVGQVHLVLGEAALPKLELKAPSS